YSPAFRLGGGRVVGARGAERQHHAEADCPQAERPLVDWHVLCSLGKRQIRALGFDLPSSSWRKVLVGQTCALGPAISGKWEAGKATSTGLAAADQVGLADVAAAIFQADVTRGGEPVHDVFEGQVVEPAAAGFPGQPLAVAPHA